MDRKINSNLRNVWAFLLLFTIFTILSGCSPAPQDSGKQQQNENQYSKEKIQEQLAANKDIFKITWSPDNSKVVYIQTGKPEKNGMDEAYLWQTGQEKAQLIRDVTAVTHGFTWSPDSKYFLISEKLGEGAKSSIIDAQSLKDEDYIVKSISIPVWSADSKFLAYGNEQHDYGESWGSLEVYQLGAEESEYIWNAKKYLYRVESWDEQGNINYTEVNAQGQESRKSTKNIRPNISGVQLGHNKEQVKAALGSNYKETPPGEETMHFPEKVYRWDYDEGYKIFIGAESGEVLEIIAESPRAETNLGIKTGDTASKVFAAYRPKYIEPESIHGGIVYGLFKVEGAAALFFNFDLKEGQTPENIKPDNKVVRIILTYPSMLDDSF